MKRIIAIVGILLAVAVRAPAQANSVSVEVLLEQAQFLPDEELRVAVRVTNFSGQPLQLGADQDWLTFTVEGAQNLVVEKRGAPNVAGEFKLESSMTATKRVDLAPHFRLRIPGRYKVTAHVRIPQWQHAISSQPKVFDIVRGTVLKEIEFGLPASDDAAGGPPESRKYVLQQADYLKELRLYVRLTDSTGSRTFKLLPLAKMLSFSRPEVQLDRYSNLHVLNQVGQRSFSYCAINPAGQLMSRQTHDFLNGSRPRLHMDDKGKISVQGGARRATESDLPPGEDVDLPANKNAAQP